MRMPKKKGDKGRKSVVSYEKEWRKSEEKRGLAQPRGGAL